MDAFSILMSSWSLYDSGCLTRRIKNGPVSLLFCTKACTFTGFTQCRAANIS